MKNPKSAVLLTTASVLVIARVAGGQGTLQVNGKDYKMEHAVAYETKYFDNKAVAVFFCSKPIPMEKLKKALKAGNDDDFTLFEPQVKLTFDPTGKLMSVFVWADNTSVSFSGTVEGAKAEVSFVNNKATGKVALTGEGKCRFDVAFDIPIIK